MAEVPQRLILDIHAIDKEQERINHLYWALKHYRTLPTPEGKEKVKVYSLLLIKALTRQTLQLIHYHH